MIDTYTPPTPAPTPPPTNFNIRHNLKHLYDRAISHKAWDSLMHALHGEKKKPSTDDSDTKPKEGANTNSAYTTCASPSSMCVALATRVFKDTSSHNTGVGMMFFS